MNILSAKYANPDHSAAILVTEESGRMVCSDVDTPDLWMELHAGDIIIEVYDTDPLATARAAKWEQMKAARDAAEFGPFTYDGMVFDGDEKAKARLSEAALLVVVLQMQGESFQTDWTLADNRVVTLTGDHIIEAGMARALHVNQIFEKARLLRERIYAPAATLEEIQLIQWDAPVPEPSEPEVPQLSTDTSGE